MASDVYDLAQGADALIVCTEWNEFQHVDLDQVRNAMRQPVMIDGRNLYDPERMARLGFRYRGVGRGSSAQTPTVASAAS